jgi:predicted acetyltransferase
MAETRISLRKATESDATLLGNLFQFFCHDLAGVDEPMPMADGRYVVDHLSLYYTHPGMETMLICEGDAVVGFVVVSVPPHFMDTYCVQHLFVLNGHRRKGIASDAMRMVFGKFPGPYRVGQPYEHASSIDFWKTLYANEGIEYQETVEGEGLDKERVQRFVV